MAAKSERRIMVFLFFEVRLFILEEFGVAIFRVDDKWISFELLAHLFLQFIDIANMRALHRQMVSHVSSRY